MADFCNIVTGSTPSKQNKSYYASEYPFFKPTDLDAGFKTATTTDMLSAKGYEVARKLPPNTVLVTSIGATIGKTGLIRCEGASNQQINAIVPRIAIDAEWIYFFIISAFFQNQIKSNASATTLPILNKGAMEKLWFAIPPFKEQHRIVAAIKSAFEVIDEIDCEKGNLRVAVASAKAKILALAISGKLVPQDPHDEPASVLLERIQAEREQLVKDGKIKRPKATKTAPVTVDSSHYEKLPPGWAVCRLLDVLDYEQPTRYIVKSTNYHNGLPTPVLTAGKGYILGYTAEENGIYTGLPVIIFDDFTTDSRYIDFPFKVKSSAMKILRAPHANTKFLFYFMQTVECDHTTHKRYWISDYSKTIVALPPVAEQSRIVHAVESTFKQLDEIIEIIN